MMKLRYVAIAGAVVLSVAACDASAPAQQTVRGDRDDIKKVDAVKEVSHKEQKYKTVCTRRVAGKCKSTSRVKDGFKKVVDKAAKPALYCVELDNVNGSAKDDDVWYTTSATVYWKAAGKREGDRMKFKPIHGGCW